MPEQPDSPFVPIDVDSDVPAVVRGQRRTWVSAGLMVAGLMCGLVGLVLVTNRYGNTQARRPKKGAAVEEAAAPAEEATAAAGA